MQGKQHVLAEVFAVNGTKCTCVYTYKCTRGVGKMMIQVKLSLDQNDSAAPILFVVIEYVSVLQCMLIKNEIMHSGAFRVYKIQGNDEPRLHILFHEKSTSGDSSRVELQYGYKYVKQCLNILL